MKTFLRMVLLLLAVLLLGVAGLVFTEAGQGWAIRRAVGFADLPPGFAVEFESAKVGLGSLRLRGVNVGAEGVGVKIPALELRGDLLGIARGKGVTITKLEARDWTLDLRAVDAEDLRELLAAAVPSRTDGAGAGEHLSGGFALLPAAYAQSEGGAGVDPVLRTVFKGIFPHLVLPVDLSVDGVDFGGRVLLPKRFWSPESPVMTIWLGVTGGGFRPGEQGKFKLVSRAQFRDETGRVPGLPRDFDTTFEFRADVAAVLEGTRQVSEVSLTLNSWAEGGLILETLHAGVEAAARRVSGGEDYSVQVSIADKRWVEVSGHYSAAKAANGGPDGVGEFVGKWDIALRDVDLPVALFEGGPLQAFAPLPPFELSGEGRFELDALFSDLRSEGRLQVSVRELDERLPDVPSQLGDLKVEADFAFQASGLGGAEGATMQERVEQLRFSITPLGSTDPLLVLAAAQPFELQGERGEADGAVGIRGIVAENPEFPLLSVDIPGLPLALMEPFLENVGLGGAVLSGRLEATLLSESQLRLRTVGPLRVEKLGLILDGEPSLESLGAELGLELESDLETARLVLKVSELQVRDSTDASLVSADLEADYRMYAEAEDVPTEPICAWAHGGSLSATGQLRVDLGGLAKQPILAKEGRMPESGTLELDFTTSASELGQSLSTLLNVQGLRVQGIALPSLEAQLGAEHDGSGTVTLSLPLTVRSATRPRVSDLKLEGTAKLNDSNELEAGGVVSAKLHGERVFLDDFQFLVALASNSDDAEQAPTVPFWQDWEGEVSVLLESVSYLGQLELRQVGGRLRLGEGKLRLENISVGARGSTAGFLRGLQDSLTGGLIGGGAANSGSQDETADSNDVTDEAKTDAASEKSVNPLDLLGEGLKRLRKRGL